MAQILIIEDEPAIRGNIAETLEMNDFTVYTAENGQAGIKLAQEHCPDLIICDIMMPDLNGYEVLQSLRNDSSVQTVPFIFLTARTDRKSMRSGMELGADDYITKPFTTHELLTAVQTRLEKHTAMTQLNDEKLEKARQQLTRLVAHELRTPLVSINTVLEIISRQLGQLSRYQLQEMLDTIGMGSKRLNRLVDQMVFLTQLETGILIQDEIVSNGVPMRLWEVLITAIDLARRFAYLNPEVDVQLDDRDNLALVMCNPAALKHALAEIITNSLSYSPAGSQATISQWKSGDSVWISVVDQGQGIPSEHLTLIVDGFHQVDRETQEQQGMGLGLALASRVIEAHGGKLEISSVVGKGTQVLVSLPVWRIE